MEPKTSNLADGTELPIPTLPATTSPSVGAAMFAKVPPMATAPDTPNMEAGLVVPMPTFPADSIRTRSVPAFVNAMAPVAA